MNTLISCSSRESLLETRTQNKKSEHSEELGVEKCLPLWANNTFSLHPEQKKEHTEYPLVIWLIHTTILWLSPEFRCDFIFFSFIRFLEFSFSFIFLWINFISPVHSLVSLVCVVGFTEEWNRRLKGQHFQIWWRFRNVATDFVCLTSETAVKIHDHRLKLIYSNFTSIHLIIDVLYLFFLFFLSADFFSTVCKSWLTIS